MNRKRLHNIAAAGCLFFALPLAARIGGGGTVKRTGVDGPGAELAAFDSTRAEAVIPT
jgi:hypothetical protein